MAERSRFWDGTTTGDAAVAPYDAATEFSEVMMAVSNTDGYPNKGVVLGAASAPLAPTIPVGGTLRIALGSALVYGAWYDNTANVDVTIPTPSVSTRIDRIVLRKSWAAQTVRVTRIAGAEGGAAPALVQTAGTTWDFPLCQVSTTTGGVNTITDQRAFSPWYRSTATTLRTDGNVGVGMAPNSAWATGFSVVQISGGVALWGQANVGNAFLSANAYYDGTDRRAIVTAAGVELQLVTGSLLVKTAPSVAAGAVQTFTSRLTVSEGGTVSVTPTGTTGVLTLQAPPSGTTGNGIAASAGPLFLYGVGGVLPWSNNAFDLGSTTFRWATIYSQNALNTSRSEYKQDITALDAARALDIVRRTPIFTFAYKTTPNRTVVGFLADNADPLLSPDQEFADHGTTAAIAIAAIQALAAVNDALAARIVALEGKVS